MSEWSPSHGILLIRLPIYRTYRLTLAGFCNGDNGLVPGSVRTINAAGNQMRRRKNLVAPSDGLLPTRILISRKFRPRQSSEGRSRVEQRGKQGRCRRNKVTRKLSRVSGEETRADRRVLRAERRPRPERRVKGIESGAGARE